MLAYVFWHWPKAGVDDQVYRRNLIVFHETLARNNPEGFERSVVCKITNPDWLQTEGVVFEEWYLVKGSAALDILNEAAVSGHCEQPHNLVAKDAAGGIAGLYRLVRGDLESVSGGRFAHWFAKPNGVSYNEFYSYLEPYTSGAGAGLWMRQMTLGPTKEFCLLSTEQLSLPTDLVSQTLRRELIWMGSQDYVTL